MPANSNYSGDDIKFTNHRTNFIRNIQDKESPYKQCTLKIVNVNCRSIKNKIAEFEHLSKTTDADIILGTESWLTDDIKNSEVFSNNYKIYRRDRNIRIGGGVFIAVKIYHTLAQLFHLKIMI